MFGIDKGRGMTLKNAFVDHAAFPGAMVLFPEKNDYFRFYTANGTKCMSGWHCFFESLNTCDEADMNPVRRLEVSTIMDEFAGHQTTRFRSRIHFAAISSRDLAFGQVAACI